MLPIKPNPVPLLARAQDRAQLTICVDLFSIVKQVNQCMEDWSIACAFDLHIQASRESKWDTRCEGDIKVTTNACANEDCKTDNSTPDENGYVSEVGNFDGKGCTLCEGLWEGKWY